MNFLFFYYIVLKKKEIYDKLYIPNIFRGLVKWYNNGLQNHCWEFDSLIPCHLEICSSYAMLELIYKKLIFSRKKLSFFIIKLKITLLLKKQIYDVSY